MQADHSQNKPSSLRRYRCNKRYKREHSYMDDHIFLTGWRLSILLWKCEMDILTESLGNSRLIFLLIWIYRTTRWRLLIRFIVVVKRIPKTYEQCTFQIRAGLIGERIGYYFLTITEAQTISVESVEHNLTLKQTELALLLFWLRFCSLRDWMVRYNPEFQVSVKRYLVLRFYLFLIRI